MPKPEDRVTIKLGPVRYDSPKATRSLVQEVIDEQPPSGGGITEAEVEDLIDQYQPVTGGVGQVIGIPPGTPFVYVPPNLVSFPIDFASVVPLIADMTRTSTSGGDHLVEYGEGRLNIDTANVVGSNGEAVIGVAGSTLRVYDTSTGLATSIALPATGMSHASCVGSDIVTHRPPAAGTATFVSLYVYNGSSVSTVSFPSATGGNLQYTGSGSSGDGTHVVILWKNSSTGQMYVVRYNTSGVIQSQKNVTVATLGILAAVVTNASGRVENGYVLISGTANIVATSDDTSSSTWRVFAVNGPGEPNMTMGPNGIGWAVTAASADPSSDIDVHILDFGAGSVNTFVQALTGWVSPFDPVATNLSATHGICYLSDTKLAVCSGYYDSIAGTVQPIYITVTYSPGSPGSLTLSQLYFTAYETSTTYPAGDDYIDQYCFGPINVGSDVVFTVQIDGIGLGGFGTLDFMYRVTA